MSTQISQLFRVGVVLSRWTFYRKVSVVETQKKCCLLKIGEQSKKICLNQSFTLSMLRTLLASLYGFKVNNLPCYVYIDLYTIGCTIDPPFNLYVDMNNFFLFQFCLCGLFAKMKTRYVTHDLFTEKVLSY